MSDSDKKYPKAVKAIYIAGTGGEEAHEVGGDSFESSRNSTTAAKMYQGWDREVRAMSMAASEFFKTYLQHHDASNEQTRDGSMKHFGKNTVKAHKAAYKVLQKNSKIFDQDPSKIHDNIVEHLENLEEEYKDEKA